MQRQTQAEGEESSQISEDSELMPFDPHFWNDAVGETSKSSVQVLVRRLDHLSFWALAPTCPHTASSRYNVTGAVALPDMEIDEQVQRVIHERLPKIREGLRCEVVQEVREVQSGEVSQEVCQELRAELREENQWNVTEMFNWLMQGHVIVASAPPLDGTSAPPPDGTSPPPSGGGPCPPPSASPFPPPS